MKLKRLFDRKKNHRREPRANAFVLESLEPRLLLSATPMTAAVVTTDHVDYAPGETAVITTSNTNGDGLQFGAGEFVRFEVTRTDGMMDAAGTTADVGPTGNEAWYVADGVGGFRTHLGSDVSGDGVADWIAPDNDLTVNSSISTTWFVEEQYRNSSLVVTAVGQESGAVASQAFTDAAENTTTTVTSSGVPSVVFPGAFESTYGDAVTFTATVTAAVGANGRPTGTVEFYDGATLLGTTTADTLVSPTQSSFSLTISTLAASDFLQGINASISAKYISNNTGDTGWNDSTSGTIEQIVNQRMITGWLTVADKVYDGTTAATETGRGLNGVLAGDVGNVVLTNGPDDNSVVPNGGPARFESANADNNVAVFLWHVALTGTAASNYHLVDYNIGTTANITARGITGSFLAANKVYDGTTAATVLGRTLTGVIGTDDVQLSGGIATFDTANVGLGKTVTLTGATLIGTAASNYKLTSLANTTTTADITLATVTVSDYTGVYDGLAHGATIVGAPGEDLSGSLIMTKHSNVGIYTESWTFANANYVAASGTNNITITKANATISVTGYLVTYDGTAHQATATATGVGGVDLSAGLNLSGTSHTNAGTYTDSVTFTDGTGNYKSATKYVKDYITKANATISVTGYLVTYDGTAHQATATATGVGGVDLSAGLNLSGTSHTNAGTYTDSVTFTDGTGNYKSATKYVKDYITKANATISVTGYLVTYDGTAHQATATATGVGGVDLSAGLNLSGTSHTNAGTYTDSVTFTDGTGNYKSATKYVKDYITKANATISVTGYLVTYDRTAHQATATATGVGGVDLSAGLNLSGTSHTNAGTYTDSVTFTDGTGNYKSATKYVKDYITQANAVITVTGYSVTFDGQPHTATGAATGVLGEDLSAGLDLSSTTHTNVGTYLNVVTFTDVTGNYKFTVKNVSSRIL